MVNRYPSLRFEKHLWKTGFIRIAGIDEAGRGAWAGPVCAAAVILPPDPSLIRTLDRVRDSKLMTPLARETWAPRIREFSLAWAVGFASPAEIDGLGILPATKLAAARSLATLSSSNSSFLDSLNPDSQAAFLSPLIFRSLITFSPISHSLIARSLITFSPITFSPITSSSRTSHSPRPLSSKVTGFR